jgi:dihydrofolate synthase/folylpolyglutamate synthase
VTTPPSERARAPAEAGGAAPETDAPSASPARETGRLEEVLTSRPLTAVEWGLDRTHAMLGRLGRPERTFRTLHVGGTNGKGSAASMAAAVLQADGRRTGLYTSPELLEMPDRFRVDGRPLPRGLLEACAARVGPLAREVDATFFEAATVLAFLAFREAGVEWAAVEVGLGGRLDATNVLRPEACAVTSVAREHVSLLGESLEEIAGEQAGIFEAGVPAVLGPTTDSVGAVFARRADEVGAPLARLGREASVSAVEVDAGGTSFVYTSPRFPDGRRFTVPLPGRHQADNAGVALMALERLDEPPSDRAMEEGLRGVRWRGRIERVRAPDGDWILDAGHNVAGVEALMDTLGRIGPRRPLVAVAAALRDKPPEMLAPLADAAEALVLTVAPSAPFDRRWDPREAARSMSGEGVEVVDDFGAALGRARELAGEGTVVVTGSCHTVGDALRRLDAGRSAPDGA